MAEDLDHSVGESTNHHIPPGAQGETGHTTGRGEGRGGEGRGGKGEEGRGGEGRGGEGRGEEGREGERRGEEGK